MSLIDLRRPSTGGKIRRIFHGSQSQVGHRKQSSPTIASQALPGLGRELSISEVGQLAGKTGRYLRIFCERVCPSAKFKTVFVQNDHTVGECIKRVVMQLSSEGSTVASQVDLFEVIGRLPANSKAISESGAVNDPGEVFSELNSRPLPPGENILNVFSLMAPAPGLCRRLELRTQPLSSAVTFPSRIRPKIHNTYDSISPSSQLMAPQCPFLLLIKGSRPKSDLLVHSFSNICQGKLSEMTMGTSAYNDIRLYLSPEAGVSRETMNINRDHYNDLRSPIRFIAKSHPVSAKSKAIRLCISSTYNVIQPEYPLTVILNWETLTDSNTFPITKSLEPGDILRIETSNLVYVFLFKDSETVAEHNLSLGFLTLPQLPSAGGKPPTGQNGSRSAARTARIDALVRKNSNLSNHSVGGPSILPTPSSLGVVVGTLFPRTSPKSGDSNWSEIGGILPDVGVAAGCFAHLLRSVVRHGLGTNGQNYVKHFNEDDLFREIKQALSMELEKLNRLASQHLTPAIWEATFCYYVAQYLSPGWLRSPVSLPSRIQVAERHRSSSRVRSADGNSNSSTTDSPSDVFNSPLQRPRQLHPANATAPDVGENYDPEFENLPMLSALRDKVAVEAEAVMNRAVQMSLKVASKGVTKICRLFSSSPGDETTRQIRDTQAALFDKLDWTGDAITQALSTRSQHSELTSNGATAIRLTQAQPYNGRDTSRGRRSTSTAKLATDGGDSSMDSSPRRNDSSVIDSEEDDDEEEEATSPSGFSSLNCDDEMPSTPGEEEDTGFGSSATGGSTKGAKQWMESVFFCRFLIGLSKRIIEEFVENRALVINWETGTQVLNLVKALSKWMHNAGVQNYKEALQLLHDFARLMATPRQELLNMSWEQLRTKRPTLPPSLLYFLLKNYESGKAMQSARGWFTNDDNVLRESPIDAVNQYAKHWQEIGQLCSLSRLQRAEMAHRPPDPATLFSTVQAKIAVDLFDRTLAEHHQVFRWNALLKGYRPPTSMLKDSGSVCSSGIRMNSSRLGSQLPDLIRLKHHGSSDSSDIRDFAELNAEVNGLKSQTLDTLDILRPTLSFEGPSHSILTGRPYNSRRATASELGGVRRTDVQHVVPVPGGGFRSRVRAYELGASSPHLQDWSISGTTSVSRGRNCARRSALRSAGLFGSSLNISQSPDPLRRSQEAQRIRDDWSEFKKSLSHPTTPSTIEPDAETLNGSFSIHLPAVMIQSSQDFSNPPRRRREDSLSSFTDWNFRKSQQSLISVDLDRSIASSVINVQLDKVANETYGLKFVEGHMTRFGQLGIYVKSITPDTSASRADIKLGDRILAINGKDVTEMTFKETCDLLKDCISRVTLTIQRGLVENPDDLLCT
ncbi:multiple pdz domain protein [Echinococcus multilocularis]|uniref:Multiple pdz domain protein n=1 Tax=Echinococcus multilocularis TaxID=6211 RepID=A0A068XZB7_ECHMU|nr:multiple pdz domain protein [Echinococcus multilocularis]